MNTTLVAVNYGHLRRERERERERKREREREEGVDGGSEIISELSHHAGTHHWCGSIPFSGVTKHKI